jgi:hypothetical protein
VHLRWNFLVQLVAQHSAVVALMCAAKAVQIGQAAFVLVNKHNCVHRTPDVGCVFAPADAEMCGAG